MSSVLTLWWMDMCEYVYFETSTKWKANKEVSGAMQTKDTFVSACHTHTHSHTLTRPSHTGLTRAMHSHTPSRPCWSQRPSNCIFRIHA